MRVAVREYASQDASHIVEVFRDSYNTLRKSRGGAHPDEAVNRIGALPDKTIQSLLTDGTILFVAEVAETGEIVGLASFTYRLANRIFKSAQGNNLYVKEKFQRGKAGSSIGTMLIKAQSKKLAFLGFRKLYFYASPESVNFQKKMGAKFYSVHDHFFSCDNLTYKYCEVELRPNIMNNIRFEPCLIELISLIHELPHRIYKLIKSSAP
jgi:hypothetical protein